MNKKKHKHNKNIVRCAMSGKIVNGNKEVVLIKYIRLWVEKQGLQIVKTFVFLAILIITISTGLALDINDNTIPQFPTPIEAINVFNVSNATEIFLNATFIRLDGGNVPTARISFGEGILMPSDKTICFRDCSIFMHSDLATDFTLGAQNIRTDFITWTYRATIGDVLTFWDTTALGTGVFDGDLSFQGEAGEDFFLVGDDIVINSGENLTLLDGNLSLGGLILGDGLEINIEPSTNLTWDLTSGRGGLYWLGTIPLFDAWITSDSVGSVIINGFNIFLDGTNLRLGTGNDADVYLFYDTSGIDTDLCYETSSSIDRWKLLQPIEFQNLYFGQIPEFGFIDGLFNSNLGDITNLNVTTFTINSKGNFTHNFTDKTQRYDINVNQVELSNNFTASGTGINFTNIPQGINTTTSLFVCWDIDGLLFLNETGC